MKTNARTTKEVNKLLSALDFTGASNVDLELVENGFLYWRKVLRNKVVRILDIEGLPSSLPINEVMMRLITFGYCPIFKNKKMGNKIVTCDNVIYGLNQYNHATAVKYYQAVQGSGNLQINQDCVVVYMTTEDEFDVTHTKGLLQMIIDRYALMLANLDSSFYSTTIVSRASINFTASGTNNVKSVQKYIDDVKAGKFSFIELEDGSDLINKVEQSEYLKDSTKNITELLNARKDVLSSFYESIGVRSKRNKVAEMTAEEVSSDEQELNVNQNDIIRCVTKGFDAVNSMFNLNIAVSINKDFKGGYTDDVV